MEIKSLGYSIFFKERGFLELKNILRNYSKKILLVDENTKTDCLPYFIENIKDSNFLIIETKSGEDNKNKETVEKIIIELIKNNIDRNSLMINLGGGVLSDVGGFVASIYKRGINYVNIPTTLLSMVDASIGSKTGINVLGLKNLIGSFYSPKMVLIDNKFLKTLKNAEILSGFAEMIKHRCIKGEDVLNFSKKIIFTQDELIKSISIKNEIVKLDLLEKKERKILNFGHTIGHALESFFLEKEQKLTHGHSVAIGMVCEFFLAYKRKIISINFLKEFKKNISSNYIKNLIIKDNDLEEIILLMENDKKNKMNKIGFSLINEEGDFFLNEEFTKKEIKESIMFYNII